MVMLDVGPEEMNIKTIKVLAPLILLATLLPVWATDSLVVTNCTVDLSHIVERINTNWVGRAMSDVTGTNKVASVIALKNITSMVADGHAEGIRRIIDADPTLIGRPDEIKRSGKFGDDAADYFWFDSVVILSNGRIIRIERSRLFGRFSTEKGQAYFRISDERPNQAMDSDKK